MTTGWPSCFQGSRGLTFACWMTGEAWTTQSETLLSLLRQLFRTHRIEFDPGPGRCLEEVGVAHAGQAGGLTRGQLTPTAQGEGRLQPQDFAGILGGFLEVRQQIVRYLPSDARQAAPAWLWATAKS